MSHTNSSPTKMYKQITIMPFTHLSLHVQHNDASLQESPLQPFTLVTDRFYLIFLSGSASVFVCACVYIYVWWWVFRWGYYNHLIHYVEQYMGMLLITCMLLCELSSYCNWSPCLPFLCLNLNLKTAMPIRLDLGRIIGHKYMAKK